LHNLIVAVYDSQILTPVAFDFGKFEYIDTLAAGIEERRERIHLVYPQVQI